MVDSDLQILPLSPHEFNSLPAGFEYEQSISDTSNTTAFQKGVNARDLLRCVVCGRWVAWGPYPGVTQAHVIDRTEDVLWASLKKRGFVPMFAKSVEHEPRNGINLCDNHYGDFEGYRFFIRWIPSIRIFVFVNFSRNKRLEEFHGKAVVLDANHHHSPFPAPFLIHEMRTRGFNPWCKDRPIPHPRSTTYTPGNNPGDGMGSGLAGSGGMASSSEPSSTGINQQYLDLSNPFQKPELLDSMRRQWQQLPNWKSATVEGLTWEGTAEENARKYTDVVGINTD